MTHSNMGIIATWVLLLVSLAAPSSTCPAPCQCKWQDGLNTLDCVEKNITKLPLSSDTIEAMVLDRNDLSKLEPYEFYNAKWSHVRRVSMKFCLLDCVQEDLFTDLTNLHYLDLSHNSLSYLDKFPSLPVLRTLDLSNNLLTNIHKTSFSTIGPSLERIDLSQNLLTTIPATTFTLLPRLRQLSLGGNPWHCDCTLGELNSELSQKSILPREASCSTPARLATKSWSSFHPTEFTCPPTVSLPHYQQQSVQSGEDVPLHCQVSGNPIPTVTWRKDGYTIPQVSSDLYSISQKTGGAGSAAIFSMLTIRNMSRPSLGLYSCVAKNMEGVDEKELQVTYSEAEESSAESGEQSVVLIVAISASTAVIVSILLMLIGLYCQRKMKVIQTSTHLSCYNDNKPSFTPTNPVPKPPRVGDYGKMSCEDIPGTLSRCSTRQTYLPAETCDRDTSHLSGDSHEDDSWARYENFTPHGHPSMHFIDSLDQIPLMSNLAGSRASIGTLSTISTIDPVYGTMRRPYQPQHTTALSQAMAPPPNCHPRPGYVTLPRRPKQRPALPLGDSLGPRSSADGCSHSNISTLPLDQSMNHQCKSTTLLPYTPPTPASITAINTVGLPAVDNSTSEDDFPMRTSTPKTVPDLSPPASRAHLDTIPEQE